MPHTSETQLPASRFSPAVKRTLRHAGAVVFGFTTLFVVYFAPAIFTNRLLAPGDGVSQYLPNFYSERVLWDTLILGGFPMLADSQFMSWYPLAFCFAFGFGGYNAFLIAAYVLAGSFTYGYVYTLTESRLAGAASGIVYSTSGFMMAHLGHTTIVHTAAWLPLLIWSLEMLRRGGGGRARVGWFVAGALAVACGAFAGHPQMFTYMMCLAGAYALIFGWTTPLQHGGRWRYFLRAALLVLLGVGMAAVQLWPTAELAGESLRQKMSFPQFVSYAIPPDHLPLLLLPLVFGGSPHSFYGTPYFGAWGPIVGGSGATELTGYIGLLPLMLAIIGIFVWPERRLTIFWISAAAVALLLVLGDATPLAALTFRLPVINLYRVPARHLLEVGLAASVLAGLGVAAVQRGAVSSRQVWGGVAALAALLAGALLLLAWHDDAYRALAIKTGVGHVSFAPWRNPAVGLPLLLFAAGAGVLVYWQRRPRSPVRWVLLLIVLTLDLASLGWVSEWRYYLQRADVLARPDYANRYSQKLNATRQRMLPIRGGLGETTDIPPNRSRIWDVPSASAYGPFLLSRVAGLLSMAPHGAVDESWREGTNQGVNLMAIRYVFTPRAPTALTPTDARTERWAADDMSLMLGSGCGQPRPTEVTIELPAAVNATAISIASALACAIEMPDETEVARVELTDEGGQVHTRSLLAGRDTSEWAGGCADVRPLMKHRLAPVFRTYEIEREGKMCEGRQFQTTFTLDGERRIKSLRLLRQGTIGSLIVLKISLLDEPAGRAYPLSPSFVTLADPLRWRHVEDIGESSVFENLRALPRAWLVPEVVALRPDEVLAAIRSSRLPDGRSYEPRQIALVEQPELTFKAAPFDAQGMAEVRDVWSKGIEVATRSQSPAFLVLSDVYYPGWRAEVDGKAADVWRTNYALRGVAVPAGEHVVRFTYRPRSFYRGALVSGASLLALAAFTVWGWRRQRRGHDDDNDEQAPPTTTTTDTHDRPSTTRTISRWWSGGRGTNAALMTLALLLWGFLLFRAVQVFNPASTYVQIFNSDSALPVLMANDATLDLFRAYIYGQDQIGAWPFLAARLVGRLLGYTWTAHGIFFAQTCWLFLSCLPVAWLQRRHGLLAGGLWLATLCLHPGVSHYLFVLNQRYAWQLTPLMFSWWALRRLCEMSAGVRPQIEDDDGAHHHGQAARWSLARWTRVRPSWARRLSARHWSLTLFFAALFLFAFLAIWMSPLSVPALCLLFALETFRARLLAHSSATATTGGAPARLASWDSWRGLAPIMAAAFMEWLLKAAYHRHALKHFGKEFRTPVEFDHGFLWENLSAQWQVLTRPQQQWDQQWWWWPLTLLATLASCWLLVSLFRIWRKTRRPHGGKHQAVTDVGVIDQTDVMMIDQAALVLGAGGLALLNFAPTVLFSWIRLNAYGPRYLALTHLFGTFAGLLAVVVFISRLPSVAVRRDQVLTSLTALVFAVLLLGFPPISRNPAYDQLRNVAAALAQKAPPGGAVLLGGYWDTYVFAGLRPNANFVPVPAENQEVRTPWTPQLLRQASDVIVVHHPFATTSEVETPPAYENFGGRAHPQFVIEQHGATLELVDAHWLEAGDFTFALYRNRTPKPSTTPFATAAGRPKERG